MFMEKSEKTWKVKKNQEITIRIEKSNVFDTYAKEIYVCFPGKIINTV